MDNIIDYQYFWGKLKLPYLNISPFKDTPSSQIASNEIMELNRNIARYQKEFLINLFGSEVVPSEVTDYLTDVVSFISPLANYVFCKILPTNQSTATASGVTVKQTEVSQVVLSQSKYSDAWNEMVEMNLIIRGKLDELKLTDTYPVDMYFPGTEYKKDFFSKQYFI